MSNQALITEDGKYGMLATWIEGVRRAGVKNFMVIALDEQTSAPPPATAAPSALDRWR